MQWVTVDGFAVHAGREHVYIIDAGKASVRLTRWRNGVTRHQCAAEAARNVITFPLGRGPGRPGGEPELAALTEAAKTWAERFEAGGSLKGYPAWQQPIVTKTGRVLTEDELDAFVDEAERGYDVTRFRAAGDANDCPEC